MSTTEVLPTLAAGASLVIRERGKVTGVLSPLTGQIVALGDPTDQLASVVEQLQELERLAQEARAEASIELTRRLDAAATWTTRVAGFEIRAQSPEAGTVTYDEDKLRDELAGLVAAGKIDQAAADQALEYVEPEPFWRVKPGGVKKLEKLGGAVAAAMRRTRVTAKRRPPEQRKASVKRVSA